MSTWVLYGLCVLLLVGSGAAADVPFIFDKNTPGIANYTSAQFEQAYITSPELTDVPSISEPADSAMFPVVGGGSTPQGTMEKTVGELKKKFDSRVEPDNSKVHEKALLLVAKFPGECTVDQVTAIYEYLKDGWHYVGDPRGVNNFFYANETLNIGDVANCAGVGDCGDFAILMSALVESIGGTTRIVLASNNTTGGHAYAEVYLGQINSPNNQVYAIIKWLMQKFDADKIFVNINTSSKDVWLNLDWWPDQAGNPHPGGPFFPGDKNIVLHIREKYKKVPLILPGKANKLPKLIRLTLDKDNPQEAGTIITWTATANDPDNDPIFCRFFLNGDPVTEWTTNNKWIWNTNNTYFGENQIEVQVRDGKHAGPGGFDDHKVDSFNITEKQINRPPVINNLVPDKTSPQNSGTNITWTAAANDPDNDPILYRFFLNNRPVTDWISINMWTWITNGTNVGRNQIEVQVRDGKHASPDKYDDENIVSFMLVTNDSFNPYKTQPEDLKAKCLRLGGAYKLINGLTACQFCQFNKDGSTSLLTDYADESWELYSNRAVSLDLCNQTSRS